MDIVNFLKSSFSLYLSDAKSYKYIKEKVDWTIPLVIALLISIVSGVLTYINNPTLTEVYSNVYGIEGLGPFMFLQFAFVLIGVFLGYGILRLCFNAVGGKGNYKDLVKFGLSISIFPSLVSLIFTFIPASMFVENIYLTIVQGLVGLVIGIWAFVVMFRVFSKLEKVNYWRVLLALVLPMIVVIVLVILIAIFGFILGSAL